MLKFRCFRRMNGFKNYRSFANSKTNLYLWGSGKSGSLGNGHSDDVPVPMKLEMPKNERFESISFGSLHTALLTKSGKVFTAGSNLNGQLGIGGTSEKVEAFQEVKNIEKITSIACGEKHTLALDIKGQAFSWGFGGSLFSAGALGTGQKQSHDTPTRVKQPEPFHSIAAGSLHSLALSKTGKVYAWGSSERGALGVLGSQSFFLSGLLSPTSIDYFARHKIERIFARSKVSAALTDDGKLFMWGSNDKHQQEGQLLQWGQFLVWPTKSDYGLPPLKDVALGAKHYLALAKDGRLFCWGSKGKITPKENRNGPAELEEFKGKRVLKIFSGEDRVAVLAEN